MQILTINHATRYRYRRPVRFGPHRFMFRPRDSHDIRVASSALEVRPEPSIRWFHDVFGNSVGLATFDQPAEELYVKSTITVEQYGAHEEEDLPIDPNARHLPISYASEEFPDLARTIERHYADPERLVDQWARGFIYEKGKTDTWVLLQSMTAAIKEQFDYIPREAEGVQSPLDTLAWKTGTCRDYALFMMEALRSLGLAARFVTGYLYDPALEAGGAAMVGAGSTHAWVQVYLPGPGWVECDPTNGIIGSPNLIRVGVARDPAQAVPLAGTFFGDKEDFLDMDAKVTVTADREYTGAAAAG